MKNLIRNLFLCFVCCFFSSAFSFGQQAPGIEWQNTIGGNAADVVYSMDQTSDGGYIFGGTSASGISGDKIDTCIGQVDYWMVKTDSSGNIQWQQTIGGSDQEYLVSIMQTTDNGYILGGSSLSGISGNKTEINYGSYDYWIVKTDSLGQILWQNTIGGSRGDVAVCIQQTQDGGYILGGTSTSNISGDKSENNCDTNSSVVTITSDYWIIKLDALGNIMWQNTIGGSKMDALRLVQQTSDGGYILGGYSQSNISYDKTENNMGTFYTSDYWILKTDSSGNILWQNTIGGDMDDVLNSMQPTSDGGYFIGGYSESNISGDKTLNCKGIFDYWVVKTDNLGNIQWENTIGGNSFDELYSTYQTVDGSYILGGSSQSNISGDKSENCSGNGDLWIVKINVSGNVQWDNTIGGNNSDALYCIQQTKDGGSIIASGSASNISGDKTENSNGNWDFWILKLNPDTTTGISNLQFTNYDLKVFPNPAKDEITIAGYALQNNQPAVLNIYDVMGKEVFSQSLNRTSQIVNLKSFTSGVYFVQLQTGAKVSRVKFIKQ